jgi:hypothetical protein
MTTGDRVAVTAENGRFIGLGDIVRVNRSSNFPYQVNVDGGYIAFYKECELQPVIRWRGGSEL